jgi:protein-tyrosine phosphatase
MEEIQLPQLPSLNQRPVKVLFVCLGNICRSPAAEGVLKAIVSENNDDANWFIDSAGTGNYHIGDLPDLRMRIHGRQRGYDFDHRCRQVRRADFDEFDLIIPMDSSNERNLRRLAATIEEEAKIVPMATFLSKSSGYDYVPDPYYEGDSGFELVLDLLQEGCQRMFHEVTVIRKK